MKKLVIVSVATVMAFVPSMAYVSNLEEYAPPSLADHLHLTKDPVDGGWLPNLTGLPSQDTIMPITKQVLDIMREEDQKDKECSSIDPNLRLMIFQHFVLTQIIANAQNIYYNEDNAKQWAHILAMTLKESSGDPTSVTDMTGRSISTNVPHTDLQRWKEILDLAIKSRIKLNYQTNFGLTQTSSDRLFDVFSLAKNQIYDTEFLEGKEGASTPRKIPLNTAIAIRRLIWFYQDFAQGRISQSDRRIHQEDIYKPEFNSRYQEGLRRALLYCGTPLLFQTPVKSKLSALKDSQYPQNIASLGLQELENAMASIAYCKLGNAQSGYGKHELDEKCFAEWVTLCPALNIDIALLTPLSYFATRNAKPVCVSTFKRLLLENPSSYSAN